MRDRWLPVSMSRRLANSRAIWIEPTSMRMVDSSWLSSIAIRLA